MTDPTPPDAAAPLWRDLAALGITEALDGASVVVDGVTYDADIEDEDGDPAPPGGMWLTSDDRTLRVRVAVEVIEGSAP